MPKVSAALDSTDSKTARRAEVVTSSNAITSDSLHYTQAIILEQPIFDGCSSVAELKAAQAGFRSACGEYYSKEQNIFLKEIEIYLSCVEAQEKYDFSKASVRSNKTQLEAINEKFKLGESTETEVASAREGLATAEANQALAYANYKSAHASFYQIFGIEAIGIKMPNVPGNMPSSLTILVEHAIAANPLIDSALHKIKSLKARKYVVKGALLPKASLRIQNRRSYYNPQQDNNSNINNRSTISTLSFTAPILSRGGIEYSDVRCAKYDTRKAAINFDSIIKQTKSNSKVCWAQLEAARVRIKATAQAVKAAEVAYESMIQEEMLGSKTIVDVLRTEERLNKARESSIEARKTLILSAYRIKALVGELTAKSMKLKVDHFNPEAEFKKVKTKIVGF